MAKAKAKSAKQVRISPEEALRFLEDVRQLNQDRDEPTVSISLRVPANILRAIKLRAKADDRKYQSLIVQMLRKALREL